LVLYFTPAGRLFVWGRFFHELSHYAFLRLFGVKVSEVRWLSWVRYEAIGSFWKQLLVAWAPFTVNLGLASLLVYLAKATPFLPLAAFFGSGLCLHAVPSARDARNTLHTFFGVFRGKGSLGDYLLLALGIATLLGGSLSLGLWQLAILGALGVVFIAALVLTPAGVVGVALFYSLLILSLGGLFDLVSLWRGLRALMGWLV